MSEWHEDDLLRPLVEALDELAARPAPPVSEALADVMAGATPLVSSVRRTTSHGRRAGVIALVSVGALAGGLGAAAANELPAPAQRVVSHVVETLTPFTIPEPQGQVPVPVPSPEGSQTPAPTTPPAVPAAPQPPHPPRPEGQHSSGPSHEDAQGEDEGHDSGRDDDGSEASHDDHRGSDHGEDAEDRDERDPSSDEDSEESDRSGSD